MVNDAPVAESEHERLNAYLAEVFADNLARQPFTASYLGIKDRQDEWNPQSEAFQDEERARMEAGLVELDGFDRSALPEAGQLSLDLYRMSLERSLMLDDFRTTLTRYINFVVLIPVSQLAHQHSPGDLSRRC